MKHTRRSEQAGGLREAPAQKRRASMVRKSAPVVGLRTWLEAERCDDEALAERALFDLLSQLPEELDAERDRRVRSRIGRTVLSIGTAAEGFSERVVERLEREARRSRSIGPLQWGLGAAVALLVCWLGALVYAALLGVDPVGSSAVVEGLQALGLGLAWLSRLLVSGIAEVTGLWSSFGAVRAWAYSPWLLAFASSALLASGAALWWLERLLPKPMLLGSNIAGAA